MRRFLTLVSLLCLAIPAGISITGCTRNPDANYCNGSGYGLKITEVSAIALQPETTGISLTSGKTMQVGTGTSSISATTCKGTAASVSSYTYTSSNSSLVDISPTGNICAGTWNRNTGGPQADYTICSLPNPLPSTGGLPYGEATITASAQSVTSNRVTVFVHAEATTVSLVGPTTCLSQNTQATLDAQACYSGIDHFGNTNTNVLLCAPASVTSASQACPLPAGISTLSSIPSCSNSIGTLSYTVVTPSVASINNLTNVITAGLPGTTAITSSVAGSGSSAGYFSTCPPESISVTLANDQTSGTITKGTTQNLITSVRDTLGNTISGLSLDYQSTDPIDISASSTGAITTNFPGTASVYAVCQPTTCNPAPTSQLGIYGTGLPLASNRVTITTPGTAGDYVWFAAPGQSQYMIPVQLREGTVSVGSTVKLPSVPNSMVMDRTGTNLYFGSSNGLMVYNTSDNSFKTQNTSVPGVVLAVSPNNGTVLINDPNTQRFCVYNASSASCTPYNGMGSAAAWTPDSKTLYITDSATLNNTPENVAAGITSHSDMLYIYNVNTGWTTHPLPCSVFNATTCPSPSTGARSLAITIPSVGVYLSGSSTTAYTWCPVGTVGNPSSMVFYPEPTPLNDPDISTPDSITVQTDALAATTDGQHILGAAVTESRVQLSDIGVTIPAAVCPGVGPGIPLSGGTLSALSTAPVLDQTLPVTLNSTPADTTINQVVASPESKLAFITYTNSGATTGAALPYYVPGASAVNFIPLSGDTAITAPIAGAFTPDDSLFIVSTAGDNMIHYIDVPHLTESTTYKPISPSLPSCTPGLAGCTSSGSGNLVPATAIAVKPRTIT